MSSQLADAIAKLEGYGVSNSIPTVANNPGSLELGDVGFGTIGAANGQQITVFQNAQDGWAALENQLSKSVNGGSAYYSPDTTLQQFGTTYSGGNPTYGSNLASALGVSPSTTLGQLQNGNTNSTVFGNLANKIQSSLNPFSGFSIARLVVLVVGLLLIAAALFSFKQTQTVIQTAAKGVAKVAA